MKLLQFDRGIYHLKMHSKLVSYQISHCTLGQELFLGFLNLSICPKKFPAGCEHSRLDPKPIFNQVPVLWVPLFQIYPCLKKAFKGLRLKLSVIIKNICLSMKIFFQIEKRNDIDIFRVKPENSFGCWQNTVWRMGVASNIYCNYNES